MKKIIQAVISRDEAKIKSAFEADMAVKKSEAIRVKRIAVASDIFAQGE